jgi:hypothetical protein
VNGLIFGARALQWPRFSKGEKSRGVNPEGQIDGAAMDGNQFTKGRK